MRNEYDVIVIGGGIIGFSVAYYLCRANQSVLLIEKNFPGSGSTGRCITGIRAQFSTEASIRLAMESIELFKSMEDEFGFSVEWYPSGYLFLAYDEARKNSFLQNLAVQQHAGLDVRFMEKKDIQKLVPIMNCDSLLGGTFCPTDGQADPFRVLKGYHQGMKKLGGKILVHSEVIAIEIRGDGQKAVFTGTGETFVAPKIVNAAGPWAREVGNMVGNDLPVAPERHEALITEGVQPMYLPMLVDYRADGCYFIQRLSGQFIGCYTPQPPVPGKDLGTTFEFLTEMPRRMIRLVPVLENIAVIRQWAGSYSMTPDGNPIVDETDIPGVYVCVGMCGHGFMLGPALGKALAHFIVRDSWSLDMHEFKFGRSFDSKAESLK
ncbi:FAD-binding oxidoreductase [candidate division KSB1 bacterium]|nr:FAD-binding oxidoreductase [candidate division KSB1 bacterium]